MYIKGASRRSVGFWARHLQDTKENIRAEIVEKRGLAADDLRDMMLEMKQDAGFTRCKNFMYIASFNPCAHEHLTEQQWEQVYEIFEKHRGIPPGQQRIVVEHEKEGRTHRHVVWNRIDLEKMRAFPDGLDLRVCEAAEKEIELKLGLERTPNLLDREPGTPPPQRNPKSYEMYRGMKSGLDPRDIAAEVTAIFHESEHAADFVEGLRQHGYELVKGKRAFCILDRAGHEHSLARRLEDVNTKELREFMQGIDLTGIPTVEQAKAQQKERNLAERQADLGTVRTEIEWEETLAKAAIEKEKIEERFVAPEDREREKRAGGNPRDGREKKRPIKPPQPERNHWTEFAAAGREATDDKRLENLRGMAAPIGEAWLRSDSAKAFAAALDDKGITFAKVTGEEAKRSDREAEFAKTLGNYAPRYREGEIVVVTEPRPEYQQNGEIIKPRRVHRLDQSMAEKFVKALGKTDTLEGIDATKKVSDQRARERRADLHATRLERATKGRPAPRTGLPYTKDYFRKMATLIKGPGIALGAVAKPLDLFAGMFEGLVAPTLTPEQVREGEIAAGERQIDAQQSIEFSNYTAQRSVEKRQLDNEREADHQRRRERDVGRER